MSRVARVAQSSNGPRVGCLFYPSGARTDAPAYDLATCRKSAPPNRHARHPKRLIRPTRDTTLSVLEGERRAGSFLGLARARRAPDPRRVGEWRVDRDHPESRKGRRKSSPLYAADDELIPVDPTRIEGPRIPAQGGSNPPAMVLAPRRRAKPRSTPYLKRHTPPSAPFAQGDASPG